MSASPPRRRTWLLQRLALVVFGALLLGGVEGILRLAWEPEPADLLAWTSIDPFRATGSDAVTRDEFLGAFRPVRFPLKKSAGTVRIFCLGGSTTFGYPYEAEVAWPAVLARRLRALYPGVPVEVINAGGTSYGSGRGLGVARAILRYEPDVIVFCGGDAEFVEDSYRVAIQLQGESQGWVRSMYLSRLLQEFLPGAGEPRVVDAGEQETTGFFFTPVLHGTTYIPTPERRTEVLARLRTNLESLVDLATSRGVRVVLCTVPSNVADWPPDPDSSAPPDPGTGARWAQFVEAAENSAEKGKLHAAAEAYATALSLWDGNADVAFGFGRVLAALGRFPEAKVQLIRARDLDPSPVRATSAANAAIREAARERRVLLADLDAAFERASPGGIVGENLILDYAHPTPLGHVLAAQVVWDVLSRAGASLETYSVEEEARLREAETMDPAGRAQFDGNLAFVWGQIYLRKGRPDRAAELLREAIESGYDLPYAQLALVQALAQLGDRDEALRHLRALVAAHPDYAEPYPLFAALLDESGDVSEAVRVGRAAIDAGNSDEGLFIAQGERLLELGRAVEAEAVVREGLDHYPGDCELGALLGRAREQQGDLPSAVSWYQTWLQRAPGCHAVLENLGILNMNRGDWQGAAESFTLSISRWGDAYPLDHLNLAFVYLEGLDQPDTALSYFAAYHRLQPEYADRIPAQMRARIEAIRSAWKP